MREPRDGRERRDRHRATRLAAVLAGALAVGCSADGGVIASERPDGADGGATAGATDEVSTNASTATAGKSPDVTSAVGTIAAAAEAAKGDAPAAPLSVTLRAEAARSAVTAPLPLTVRATNGAGGPATLLRWNTPFEPALSADLFAVTRDGEAVAYTGRMLKRAATPAERDLVRLGAGETIERVLDLARHYALDRPGTYEIRFAPRPVPIEAEDGDAPFAALEAGDGEALTIERY